MKLLLTVFSFIILIGCFGWLMDRQEHIPLPIQIIGTVVMISYEVALLFKIYGKDKP